MGFRRVIVLLSLLACGGCQSIIHSIVGTLPEPDPLFKVAIGSGPGFKVGDRNDCLGGQVLAGDCSGSSNRVKKYLSAYLPSSPDELVSKLQKMGFWCQGNSYNSDFFECSYTRSQPMAPCELSVRPSIKTIFPTKAKEITEDNLSVESLVVADPDNKDDRACFPL